MPRSPGPESEAPPPLLVETLFTIDVATRVCVIPCNDGRLWGVEWVMAAEFSMGGRSMVGLPLAERLGMLGRSEKGFD